MLKKSVMLTALLGLAGLCSSAGAALNSSASLTAISYTLVDLEPNDGVDASIIFTDYRSYSSSSAASVAGQGLDWNQTVQDNSSNPLLGSSMGARAALTSGSINGSSLAATGALHGPGEYYTNAWQSIMFTLSAHTHLVITGHVAASAEGNLVYPDQVSSSAWLQVIDSQHASPFGRISFKNWGAYSYSNPGINTDEDFTLEFANVGSTVIDGTMDVAVGAYGTLAPVPEPATYGMLLAGLGLMGVALRRQKGDHAA